MPSQYPQVKPIVGGRGIESNQDTKKEDKTKMVHESADLLFHLLVLWKAQGINPSLVMDELKNRENVSGLKEKRNR